ncbi:hypothetical protein, partial [Salegentibacter sp. F14]
MIWKTTLVFWVTFFWVGSALAQFSPSQPDLRDCTGWNCTSNNFTLDQVYITLEDGDGNPLTDQACNIGDQEGVYVMLNYTSNANNTVNNARIFADLSVDGNLIPLNIYIGEISGSSSGQQQIYGPFTWTCGQELILENILAVWRTGGGSAELLEYDCSDYNNAQCEFPADTVIGAPLAVEFDYTACTYDGVTTVNYNSTTTGGIPPYTYQWDFENDGTIDSVEESPTHAFSSSGNTTKLIITDSQNLVSQYELLIENPTELTADAVVTQISCSENNTINDGAISLSVSGGTGSYNYSWSGPAGYTSNQQNIENLVAGTYIVEITDSVGCIKSYEFQINEPVAPIGQITGNQELTCDTTSITLDASGSTVAGTASYLWNSGETTATLEVSEPGTYTVTVTDTENGCSDTAQVTVEQNIEAVDAQITGNQELTCDTTSITLDASGSTVAGTASYLWDSGETTATLEVSEPGTYTVTVTDTENGCSDTAQVTVEQNIEAVDAQITGNQELTCDTTSITLDASGSTVAGTASYLWDSGETTTTLEVSEPGTYTVTVTDTENGCSNEAQVTVTEDVTPVVAQITGNQELTCDTTSITLDASGSTFQGTASYLWNTGETTASIDVSEAGDYSVIVTDSDNG